MPFLKVKVLIGNLDNAFLSSSELLSFGSSSVMNVGIDLQQGFYPIDFGKMYIKFHLFRPFSLL